jgi:hypothetical protein
MASNRDQAIELCVIRHARPKHLSLFYPQYVQMKVLKIEFDYYYLVVLAIY